MTCGANQSISKRLEWHHQKPDRALKILKIYKYSVTIWDKKRFHSSVFEIDFTHHQHLGV